MTSIQLDPVSGSYTRMHVVKCFDATNFCSNRKWRGRVDATQKQTCCALERIRPTECSERANEACERAMTEPNWADACECCAVSAAAPSCGELWR